MSSLWTLGNPIFVQYLFYASILALKMIIMSPLTSRQRYIKRVFANPEDAKVKHGKVTTDDDVERVRRAHQNDIENIVPFWILGLLLVQVDPSACVASNCFRFFTLARISHTVIYLNQMSWTRGGAFMVGFAINIYMALYILLKVAFL